MGISKKSFTSKIILKLYPFCQVKLAKCHFSCACIYNKNIFL